MKCIRNIFLFILLKIIFVLPHKNEKNSTCVLPSKFPKRPDITSDSDLSRGIANGKNRLGTY